MPIGSKDACHDAKKYLTNDQATAPTDEATEFDTFNIEQGCYVQFSNDGNQPVYYWVQDPNTGKTEYPPNLERICVLEDPAAASTPIFKLSGDNKDCPKGTEAKTAEECDLLAAAYGATLDAGATAANFPGSSSGCIITTAKATGVPPEYVFKATPISQKWRPPMPPPNGYLCHAEALLGACEIQIDSDINNDVRQLFCTKDDGDSDSEGKGGNYIGEKDGEDIGALFVGADPTSKCETHKKRMCERSKAAAFFLYFFSAGMGVTALFSFMRSDPKQEKTLNAAAMFMMLGIVACSWSISWHVSTQVYHSAHRNSGCGSDLSFMDPLIQSPDMQDNAILFVWLISFTSSVAFPIFLVWMIMSQSIATSRNELTNPIF